MADLTKPGDGAIVHYTVADPELTELCGLGVFAPFVVQGSFRRLLGLDGPGRIPYSELAIFGEGSNRTRASQAWAELVEYTLLTTELDEALDREYVVRDVASLPQSRYVSAADAAFNILDRILDGIEAQVAADVARARLGRDVAVLTLFAVPALKLLAAQDGWTARWRGSVPAGTTSQQAPSARPALLTRFSRLEGATRLAEHAVLQMIVHGNFGLGKGQGNEGLGKGQGNEGLGKGQGNEGPLTGAGYGEVDRQRLSNLATVLPSNPARIQLAASLIATVADALRDVEGAVLQIERLAGSLLLDPEWDRLPGDALADAVRDRLEAAFGLLRESVRGARLTVRNVLEHGGLTLGGDDGLLELEREQVAFATGLSRRGLVLLRHRRVRDL